MEIRTQKKLTYLQETKDAIKSALIEKGQTVSDTDTFRSYADKILAIQGGGATETDIIPEQEFALALNSQLGVHMASGFDLFSLKSGEKYYVVWGEETFTCTAVDGVFEGAPCVAIGNPYPVGGTNNNLPFVIGCVPNFDGHTLCVIVALAEQTETKKVRVYQKASGGCDAVVWFVTFIGADGTELYRMPVLDGDDCKDPYTRGDIEKPTKESTVSQVFTYNGWALTEGGSADANVLKAVTEDKTVYAAFTATARKYTVRFFDGDTLLATKQVAYGGTATYDATKENYMLAGWNPEPTNIAGDMDCYAVWLESQAFAVASWDFITKAVNAGQAKNIWSIGDEKDITLTWEDGSTETCTLQIADFDEVGQNKTDSNPYMTLISKGLLSKPTAGPTNQAGYVRVSSNSEGYIYSFLQNTVKPALPSDLASAMKKVYLYSQDSGVYWSICDLYIPHMENVGCIPPTASYASNLQNQITDHTYSPLFDTTNSKRIKYTPDGTAQEWWLDGNGYNNQYFGYVFTDGRGQHQRASSTYKRYVCIKLFV